MMMLKHCFTLLLCVAYVSGKRKTEKDVNVSRWNFCSCDMTSGTCDIYCCCDQDCTDFHKQVFLCRNVTFYDQNHFWKCDSFNSLPGHGFEQLLCVAKENTPYIGMYFEDYPVVKDLPALNSLLNSKHKGVEETVMLSVKLKQDNIFSTKHSIDTSGYVFGKELLVQLQNSPRERFCLPHSLYSYHCDSLYPVQYLKESSTMCVINVQESCSTTSSLLDTKLFLINSDEKKLLGSVGDDAPLQDIKVRFSYFKYPCCYLKNCSSDIVCQKKSLPSHSAFPTLFFNGTVCHNSVVDVHYAFKWHGGRIHSADVDIVLQNISVNDAIYVTQHLSVVYLHKGNETDTTSVKNESAVNNIIRGSYEIGNPLIGRLNETLFWADDYVDENTSFAPAPLYMWKNSKLSFKLYE